MLPCSSAPDLASFRYPAGVDTPVHIYALYSDLNPNWKSCYAQQPEVLAYLEALIDKHSKSLLFSCVPSARR